MPPVLSSWATVIVAQELMYRCEQHLSGSEFWVLIFFRRYFNTTTNQNLLSYYIDIYIYYSINIKEYYSVDRVVIIILYTKIRLKSCNRKYIRYW